MQSSSSLYLSKSFFTTHHHHLGFNHTLSSTHNSLSSLSSTLLKPCSTRLITAQAQKPNNHKRSGPKEGVRVRGNKENVWSIDNELAKVASASSQKEKRRKRRVVKRKGEKGGRIIVSGAMLVEVETVLQTQVTFTLSGVSLNF